MVIPVWFVVSESEEARRLYHELMANNLTSEGKLGTYGGEGDLLEIDMNAPDSAIRFEYYQNFEVAPKISGKRLFFNYARQTKEIPLDGKTEARLRKDSRLWELILRDSRMFNIEKMVFFGPAEVVFPNHQIASEARQRIFDGIPAASGTPFDYGRGRR